MIKVYLHQVHADLTMKGTGKNPCPNTFVVSANQIAGNAAVQAHMLGGRQDTTEN
jgi:hypothetical protein